MTTDSAPAPAKFAAPVSAATAPPPSAATTLNELRPGDKGVVEAVLSGAGDLRRRLLELGFVKGVCVRVVRVAPLRDPMEIELHGYHLSIRRSEARAVTLKRVASD